jgi:signal transduction histidine kinase
VRYDSMVATALAFAADDAAGQTAQWRQLVDLVVQARGGLSAAVRASALAQIAGLRSAVPLDQRRLAATQLATRATDLDSVALFGADEAVVAAPVLSVAHLDAGDWRTIIPQLPPASRALLRNRRDLPDAVVVALGSYGSSDFALPSDAMADVSDPGAQIRELVARIEAFRQSNSGAVGLPAIDMPADRFAFETTADGMFDWVVGAPREALIGTSVSEIAAVGGYGVDGQAAGAFRRRAPFRDARLSVAGAGPTGGDWLISASPVFNPRDGRFAGYHGSARRPRPDEIAGPVARFAGTTLPVDSLRQLIHELRTPLNAILGFAEMIDQQLLGPAASSYRDKAHEIVRDGRRLLEMVDDLDQAARARREMDDANNNDARAILDRVAAGFRPTNEARQIALQVIADEPVDVGGLSGTVLERMITRLVGAALGLAKAGETVAVDLSHVGGQALLSVARPIALAGVGDAALLDPGFDPETPYPDAPLLGLGFTLRLIDSLARDAGGRFTIRADAFVLMLPGTAVPADLPAGIPKE